MADDGVSILETESYTLAILFLIFLALFVTVEKVRCRFGSACCAQSPSFDNFTVYSLSNGDKLA